MPVDEQGKWVDPPEESPYHKANADEKRRWRAAALYTANPSPKFVKWLEEQGIDEVPERRCSKRYISNQLKKRKSVAAASSWRVSTCRRLRGWDIARLTPTIANELSWRLTELKMKDFPTDAESYEGKALDSPIPENLEEVEGMEFLPPWMRWAVMHPALLIPRGETSDPAVDDPELKRKVRAYEEACPCPHQAAKNHFELYRGSPRLLDGLFKQIAGLQLKKGGEDGPTEKTEEQESIDTLESILGGVMCLEERSDDGTYGISYWIQECEELPKDGKVSLEFRLPEPRETFIGNLGEENSDE